MGKVARGSILGGVLLVAGSCIGAGMLAIPIMTGIAGFFPSVVMFFLAWAFMTATALLLLEVNLSVGHHLSLISLSEKTLGKWGKRLTWFFFLFLFYLLNVAYIAASGPIVESLIHDIFKISLPNWVGSLFFTTLFAFVIYKGVKSVDHLNRLLMVGLIIAYISMVLLGVFYVKSENLQQSTWKFALASLPILIISFGFHNMVPTLTSYFEGDKKALKRTLILGSLIPLGIYLLWEAVLLGIIPVEGKEGIIQGLKQGEPVTEVLRNLLGKAWISTSAEAFSLFAITTSFLAQSLSLVDFIKDGLKISNQKKNRFFLTLVVLLPPFIAAFLCPKIFIHALNLAGGLSATILFGVFPVLMVWKLRYVQNRSAPILFGGKLILGLILFIALGIFFMQLLQELGVGLLEQRVESC